MSNKARIAALLIPIVIVIILPFAGSISVAHAYNSNVWNPSIIKGPLVTCTGNGAAGTKACTNLCDLFDTIANIIYYGIGILIWILIPLLFLFGGFSIMTAGGNPEALSSAKKRLMAAFIGLGIALFAYIIVSTVLYIMNIAGVGFPNVSCNVAAAPSATVATTSGGATAPTENYKCVDNCEDLASQGFSCKPASDQPNGIYSCEAAQPVVGVLTCLKSRNAPSFEVTEAYPETVSHINPCHTDGCCVDIVIQPFSSCSQVTTLINDVNNYCGGKALNEYYKSCGGTKYDSTDENIHIQADGCN